MLVEIALKVVAVGRGVRVAPLGLVGEASGIAVSVTSGVAVMGGGVGETETVVVAAGVGGGPCKSIRSFSCKELNTQLLKLPFSMRCI